MYAVSIDSVPDLLDPVSPSELLGALGIEQTKVGVESLSGIESESEPLDAEERKMPPKSDDVPFLLLELSAEGIDSNIDGASICFKLPNVKRSGERPAAGLNFGFSVAIGEVGD